MNAKKMLRQATCAVLVDDQLVGTAWLLSHSGHLLTAGHLLGTEEPVVDQVEVQFVEDEPDEPRQATRVEWRFDQKQELDFAVLKLTAPINRPPLPISLVKEVEGQFQLCGVGTTLREGAQVCNQGEFLSPLYSTNSSTTYLFRLRSSDLGQRGNSGGAVFSDQLEAVVGIQTEATRRRMGPEADVVLAMPLSRVADFWEPLKDLAQRREETTTSSHSAGQRFADPKTSNPADGQSRPFSYNRPVSAEDFIGRWALVDAIVSDLCQPEADSWAIIGGRRFGKSSVLKAIESRLLDRLAHPTPKSLHILPLMVDLKGCERETAQNIYACIARRLHERLANRSALELDLSPTRLGGDSHHSHHFGHSSTSNPKTPEVKSSSNPQEKGGSVVESKKLSFEERTELVEHLLAIPSIADQSRRATVIHELPFEIKSNVAYKPVAKDHVFNILNTCLQYPLGMENLRHKLQYFEGNSIAMQNFEEVLNRLLPRGLGRGRNDEQDRLGTLIPNEADALSFYDFEKSLKRLVEHVKTHHGLFLRLVLLLDEFEVATHFPQYETLFDNLRYLIYNSPLVDRLNLVLTGSARVIQIKQKGSPLLNAVNIKYLELFSPSDIKQLIARGGQIPHEALAAVQAQSGGHPFIGQYLLYHLWTLPHGLAQASSSQVEKVARQMQKERDLDMSGWWEAIGESGQQAYALLAKHEGWIDERTLIRHTQSTALVSGLTALCYHGVVAYDDNLSPPPRYRVAGKLFRTWYFRKCYFPNIIREPPIDLEENSTPPTIEKPPKLELLPNADLDTPASRPKQMTFIEADNPSRQSRQSRQLSPDAKAPPQAPCQKSPPEATKEDIPDIEPQLGQPRPYIRLVSAILLFLTLVIIFYLRAIH